MALCDATAPAKSGDPVVAPGPYGAGSTVYISVPFSEIVTVSGTPSLHTDWGDYDYFSGSGSNVPTFSGTIPATFGAQLIIRSLSGTITDLAGNALSSTDCYKSFSSITVALPWGGSGTQADPYVISRADQLDYMATRVNADYGADSFSGKYFVLADDITYSHSINWDTYSWASSTTENNFTPIGCYGRPFQGHFDGQGHTISGIRVWTEYILTDNTNESLGLFGFVSGGSVSNVVLRDANIRGLKNLGGIVGYLSGGSVTGCTLYQVLVGSHAKANMATGMGIVAGYVGGTVTDCYYRDCVKGLTYQDGSNDITIMPHPERWDNVYTITTATGVGGIVGLSYGTVTNCTVAADVLVASKHTGANYHGGIVGNNHGTVTGCTSAVTLTAAYTGPDDYGAVVGINQSDGTIENCLALGATIPVMDDHYGVIAGYNSSGTLTANYYRDCTVGSTANAVGVGAGKSGGAPNDVDGTRSVHALTLPDGVTASGESVTIGTDTYYAATTDVTLACTGTAPSGYVEPYYYSLDGTNISGSTVTMPASDATVALLWTTDYETGHAGTEADPYIISDYPQLELLASRVNNGYNYSSGKHFKLGSDIACFDGENNHAPIGVHGTYQHFFGTFDGNGHTVSGIRISSSTGYQGLFGNLSGATVKNVTLADCNIIGCDEVGGIVGYSFTGTFENCRVLGDVTIGANASSADNHGGIVGYIFGRGTVNGCYSAATVTRDGNSNCTNYGGIVGKTNGTVSNCIADGAWVIGSEESSSGAIVGTNDGGTLARNYYYGCSVKSFANNVGTGSGDVTENDGAVRTDGIPLLDNYSNDFVLRRYADGDAHDFTLAGRTLYRDGDWNTLCLPFDVTAEQIAAHADFAGATLMTLSTSTFSGGLLTLTFAGAESIEAGVPYIVKWASGTSFTPTFQGVTVSSTADTATEGSEWVNFVGTYSPAVIYEEGEAKHNLYLGSDNTLYYPTTEGFTVNACRAYFVLKNGLTAGTPTSQVRAFNLNLGGDEETAIVSPSADAKDSAAWYTLDGRRLSAKPTASGIYVNNGRKVVIK